MGLFDKLKKAETFPPVDCKDNEIIAPADGTLIDITTVKDSMFAEKILGDGIALVLDGDTVTISAPCSGKLTAFFPTGHAFGIETPYGTEILVHIGINTVEAHGDGFTLYGRKQDEQVRAGEPMVKVDVKKLSAKYDMTTMLVVTETGGHNVEWVAPKAVHRADVIGSAE